MRSIVLGCASLAAVMALSPARAEPGNVSLSTKLAGSAETPPNAETATGRFAATLNPATGRLCYTLTSRHLSDLTMAHIHVGAPGVAGPPAVTLMPDSPGKTCLTIDTALAAKITATPGDYYVNIHTAALPKGAIRGQLK